MEDDTAVSVVVPVYNDPDGILTTLKSLISQVSEVTYEINVVNNMSTDNTVEVVKKMASNYEGLINIYHECTTQSSYAARNKGIENSNGEIIAFIDSDMHVEKHYVKKVYDAMKDSGANYMGCNVEIYIEDGDVNTISKFKKAIGLDPQRFLERADFFPTCCLVVHQKLFDEIGVFDGEVRSGGDGEFGRRVKEAGYEQLYQPNINMYHPARSSLLELARKYRRVGRGQIELNENHPDRYEELNGYPSIKDFSPPEWSSFRRELEEYSDGDHSIFEKFGFYGIYYYQELFKTFGMIEQRIQENHSSLRD